MPRTRSDQLFASASRLIPGGVNSPLRACRDVQGRPRYFERGAGALLTDVDGQSSVDFHLSGGLALLGHGHRDVTAAVIEAAAAGLSLGGCNRRELQWAEQILRAFPEHEQVRMVSSAAEAVAVALRLSRAATGRPLILKFDACYHGDLDGLLVRAESRSRAATPASAGVPAETAASTLVVPLGDEAALIRAFEEHGDHIAAAIIEPLPLSLGLFPQRPAFLALLRRLCAERGALLIFDEAVSGFRLRYGGFGPLVSVAADIVTLGDIVGGGLPSGAVVASSALMERLAPIGAVHQESPAAGNPVVLAAGVAMLRLLEDGGAYRLLSDRGEALDRELAAHGVRTHRRVGPIFWLHLSDGETPDDPSRLSASAMARFGRAHALLLERGYFLPPSPTAPCFLCTEHSDDQLRGLAAALAESQGRTPPSGALTSGGRRPN